MSTSRLPRRRAMGSHPVSGCGCRTCRCCWPPRSGLGRAVGRMQHGPLLAALGILVAAVLARQFVVLVENQRLLSEVAQEAFRDSLTGLANRAHFLHRLEQAIARRRSDAAPIAVLCLDLDNFKSVNDALGHPAGDELLVRIAGRLTAALGGNGTVARLGGDEFAVLIEGSVEESQAAAHRVLESFSAADRDRRRSDRGPPEHRVHSGHRRIQLHRRPAPPVRRPGHVCRQTRRRPMYPQLCARPAVPVYISRSSPIRRYRPLIHCPPAPPAAGRRWHGRCRRAPKLATSTRDKPKRCTQRHSVAPVGNPDCLGGVGNRRDRFHRVERP